MSEPTDRLNHADRSQIVLHKIRGAEVQNVQAANRVQFLLRRMQPRDWPSAFRDLKVTFDLSGDSRLTGWQYQRRSQSVEIFVFSFCSQAAISAFAENSASPLGLRGAKSCRVGLTQKGSLPWIERKVGR